NVTTRLTKSILCQTVAAIAPKLFGQLNFGETEPCVFWRQCGEVEQGLFLTPNPSLSHLTVDVGTNVPAIDNRLDYGRGGPSTTLLVSRPLSLLRSEGQGERTYYHFANVEELREKLPEVYADFVEQAEPWLARLTTVEDVAKEFFKGRIAPPASGGIRPRDAFAWAIY